MNAKTACRRSMARALERSKSFCYNPSCIRSFTRYSCYHQYQKPPRQRQHNNNWFSKIREYQTDSREIETAVDNLEQALNDPVANAPKIWANYDQIKIRRMLSFIPFEMWASLLKSCQGRYFLAEELISGWTPSMAKRRALMFLSDMWRYSGCCDDAPDTKSIYPYGESTESKHHEQSSFYSIWRPATYHYNIVFDVICKDPLSLINEIISLHRDMKLRSIQEDSTTFNTLLNGCRQLKSWEYFREVEEQIRQRDEWGITRIDATTWGTLIQGYKECRDWESADRCIDQAIAFCKDNGGTKTTTGLWSIIISVYAARNMLKQMIVARKTMNGLDVPMNAFTFGPIFAALRRLRKMLLRQRKDTWPAVSLALDEYEAMRRADVLPSSVTLTNIILTIGLPNPYAQNNIDERLHNKIQHIGGRIARELEAALASGRDPNIYAALFNVSGKEGSIDDIQALWKKLLAESEGQEHNSSLNCLTLASYMNALIRCKRYDRAMSAFYDHALLAPAYYSSFQSSMPKIDKPDLSVYEASLMAFARADRHPMCATVVRRMIQNGVSPSALTLRYSLLPPDYSALSQNAQALHNTYTRRWSLPLSLAREIWDMVIETRHGVWSQQSGPQSPEEKPVIVNDIAAQFIRIAAYARNTAFGEQIFAALNSEAAYFGSTTAQHQHEIGEDSRFPEDLQCAPNVRTYTSMITLYANDANLEGVSKMWKSMLRDGVVPNLPAYTSLIVALHKVALRQRWRHSQAHLGRFHGGTGYYDTAYSIPQEPWLDAQEYGISAEDIPEDSEEGVLPWENGSEQDAVIDSIENWIMGEAPVSSKPGSTWTSKRQDDGSEPPKIDIPLSTLLLRYHASHIRDVAQQGYKQSSMEERSVENIKRAARICQNVERLGLTPDNRFHEALADLFDACGDEASADLVRERIR